MKQSRRTSRTLSDKILQGMTLAVERCLLDKSMKGQTVIYAHPDGTIYSMDAHDALDHFLSKGTKKKKK